MTTRRTLSATTLIGDRVRNTEGDRLGDIKEIMLDLETGTVAYAVLDMGGFLGIGGKFFAVPWNAVTLDTDSHEFVLDVDKETLQEAPGFDKDDWPDFSDRAWGTTIYSYYGVRPYWDH